MAMSNPRLVIWLYGGGPPLVPASVTGE
jgi:hypothetical protein